MTYGFLRNFYILRINRRVFIPGIFLSLGWFSVAYLANESPSSQAPIGAVIWALIVATVFGCIGSLMWRVGKILSRTLSHLVLVSYVPFVFYQLLQSLANDHVSKVFGGYDRLFVPVIIVAAWVLYFVIRGLVYLIRNKITLQSSFAGYIFLVLSLLVVWNLLFWGVGQRQSHQSVVFERSTSNLTIDKPDDLFPIYWFIFDAYGRNDVLRTHYDFDNTPFIDELSKLGFFIDKEATTNFIDTGSALPAIMELENLGTLNREINIDLRSRRDPDDWRFRDSAIVSLLSPLGYESKEFSSERVDSVYRSIFSVVYYESTGLRSIPMHWKPWKKRQGTGGIGIVKSLKLTEEQVGRSDVIVFSYNYQPHPPYFFDAEGQSLDVKTTHPSGAERRNEWSLKSDYINQLKYINKLILQTVENILEQSETEPLIIIQSDHGPASNWTLSEKLSGAYGNEDLFYERISILSAVYIPSSCDQDKYGDSSASLNTFKFVLNNCFNTNIPLFPKDVYWSGGWGYETFIGGVWRKK